MVVVGSAKMAAPTSLVTPDIVKFQSGIQNTDHGRNRQFSWELRKVLLFSDNIFSLEYYVIREIIDGAPLWPEKR